MITEGYAQKNNQLRGDKIWSNFFFTVAVLFTLRGEHFRGSEYYDEKFGLRYSMPYLQEQIEIVKPKVIMPLGGTAWKSIRQIYKLVDYPEQISATVRLLNLSPIIIDSKVIVPNFHPLVKSLAVFRIYVGPHLSDCMCFYLYFGTII